jgi:hypothetical protein
VDWIQRARVRPTTTIHSIHNLTKRHALINVCFKLLHSASLFVERIAFCSGYFTIWWNILYADIEVSTVYKPTLF